MLSLCPRVVLCPLLTPLPPSYYWLQIDYRTLNEVEEWEDGNRGSTELKERWIKVQGRFFLFFGGQYFLFSIKYFRHFFFVQDVKEQIGNKGKI